MKTFAKYAITPAAALAGAVLLSAPAYAGERSNTATAAKADDIVVLSKAKMKAWQARTTRALDRALERSPIERTAVPGSGIVQVGFTLGADGRAEDVEIYGSSADRIAEKSAMHAVRRLRTLQDVPVSNKMNARFLANIIFADDHTQYRKLAKTLEVSERARLASGAAESGYIAVGG